MTTLLIRNEELRIRNFGNGRARFATKRNAQERSLQNQ